MRFRGIGRLLGLLLRDKILPDLVLPLLLVVNLPEYLKDMLVVPEFTDFGGSLLELKYSVALGLFE